MKYALNFGMLDGLCGCSWPDAGKAIADRAAAAQRKSIKSVCFIRIPLGNESDPVSVSAMVPQKERRLLAESRQMKVTLDDHPHEIESHGVVRKIPPCDAIS